MQKGFTVSVVLIFLLVPSLKMSLLFQECLFQHSFTQKRFSWMRDHILARVETKRNKFRFHESLRTWYLSPLSSWFVSAGFLVTRVCIEGSVGYMLLQVRSHCRYQACAVVVFQSLNLTLLDCFVFIQSAPPSATKETHVSKYFYTNVPVIVFIILLASVCYCARQKRRVL